MSALRAAVLLQNDCMLICLQNTEFMMYQLCLENANSETVFHSIFENQRADYLRAIKIYYLDNDELTLGERLLLFLSFFHLNK